MQCFKMLGTVECALAFEMPPASAVARTDTESYEYDCGTESTNCRPSLSHTSTTVSLWHGVNELPAVSERSGARRRSAARPPRAADTKHGRRADAAHGFVVDSARLDSVDCR